MTRLQREIASIMLAVVVAAGLILIIKSNIDAEHHRRITTEAYQ